MMEVVLLTGAEAEVLKIYSDRLDLGPFVAQHFDEAVNLGIKQLQEQPYSGPLHKFGFRRLLMGGHLPYAFFYQVHGGRVFVQHVLDLRQSP